MLLLGLSNNDSWEISLEQKRSRQSCRRENILCVAEINRFFSDALGTSAGDGMDPKKVFIFYNWFKSHRFKGYL